MSEYYMTHTGTELDSAISKVKSGYIMPTEIINIVSNVSNMDIANGKTLNVNVPIPDGYIDKTKISHFATGTISNVKEGQQVKITGITDTITGETFNLKGVVGIICPTATTNYTTSQGKGAVVVFYKTSDNADGIGVAAYNAAFSVRANTGMKNNEILGISGNGFSFLSPASMYALMPASRWRWFAWG